MFEITADDIALLNDEDLRTLVGLLCESEMRSRELPTSSVTWGGNQNAADGGLDVRVALPAGTAIDGFVPRPATGFQTKKEDMPRAKILLEMSPAGVLRQVIQELAEGSGAYVIVSSTGSTSDFALRNRREAMAEAVRDFPNANALKLDFYDRTRLATWVRDHIGLIPWVKQRVGKAIAGWRSYGAWAIRRRVSAANMSGVLYSFSHPDREERSRRRIVGRLKAYRLFATGSGSQARSCA